MPSTPLRAAVVGCRGMGAYHARAISSLPEYRLVAACDLNPEVLAQFGEAFAGLHTYSDYQQMLELERPDVVVIATTTSSHASLTVRAVENGVRGVFCEKPMATSLADGRAMLLACRAAGAALAINHQRRMWPVFRTMRRLIESGALGTIELIRAGCAGDVLSDGTHLADTLRFLSGDADVRWVFGQIHREPPGDELPGSRGTLAAGGMRYGHPVESGALALLEFATGMRAQLETGLMQPPDRRYQDYEVIGSEGRLRRAGDRADPQLLIQTPASGGWQPYEVELDSSDTLYPVRGAYAYALFARTILDGTAHPLGGEQGLKDLELVMAIYESARTRSRVGLPLEQPSFPLELLLAAGEL